MRGEEPQKCSRTSQMELREREMLATAGRFQGAASGSRWRPTRSALRSTRSSGVPFDPHRPSRSSCAPSSL